MTAPSSNLKMSQFPRRLFSSIHDASMISRAVLQHQRHLLRAIENWQSTELAW